MTPTVCSSPTQESSRNQKHIWFDPDHDNRKQVSYSNAVVATPSVSFTYDTNFNRILTMVDGTGTNIYAYNPVTTNAMPGAGRLASIDGPLANDIITYQYDKLGRITNRAINSVAQSVTYDALGRLTVLTNALGRFTNNYVNATFRLSSMSYPNGQSTIFTYLGNTNDQRLQEIKHLTSASNILSKFNYTYDPDGEIQTWTQQADNGTPKVQIVEYDPVDQLIGATVRSNSITGALLKRFLYSYDKAGNRSGEQVDLGATKANYNYGVGLVSHRPDMCLSSKTLLNLLSKFAKALARCGLLSVGVMMLSNCGRPNASKARPEQVQKLKAAAEGGDHRAQTLLGVCYYNGDVGGGRNVNEALSWWRKAASLGDTDAMYKIGRVYYDRGNAFSDDYKNAMEWWQKAAEKAHPMAEYGVGLLYLEGKGVAMDEAEGARWIRKAADQNHLEAKVSLGLLYETGRGVPMDRQLSVKLCREAALNGSTRGQYILATYYATGRGVPENHSEAVQWLRKAAEGGMAEAQHDLGVCYVRGTGVEKDEKAAFNWFLQAAEHGFGKAQYAAGAGYLEGRGTKRDATHAVLWLSKAAEQRDQKAQEVLGNCYAGGWGVRKDLVEAYKWFRLVEAQNPKSGKTDIETLLRREKLNQQQIEEGEHRAKQFAQTHPIRMD